MKLADLCGRNLREAELVHKDTVLKHEKGKIKAVSHSKQTGNLHIKCSKTKKDVPCCSSLQANPRGWKELWKLRPGRSCRRPTGARLPARPAL